MDFHWEYYKELNPDLIKAGLSKPGDFINHYNKHGKRENRPSKFSDLFPDFKVNEYKILNSNLNFKTDNEYRYHYFSVGRKKNQYTNFKEYLKTIDFNKYREDNKKLAHIFIKDIDDIKKYIINIDIRYPLFKNNLVKPSFGLFLIGFGMPNIEVKMEILEKNLKIFQKWKDLYDIDLYIYVYNPQFSDVLDEIDFKQYVRNVEIVAKQGIVGEFIYNNVSKLYQKYEYTMLFLDDVELTPSFDLETMVKVYNLEQIDVLSLPLTLDSPFNYDFMLQSLDLIKSGFNYRETNFAELFVYFISKRNFIKYLRMFTPKTQWCWGIDLSMYNSGLKMGLFDKFTIKHYYKATSYSSHLPDPKVELEQTKRRLKFINDKVIFKKEKY
jgi:hypothetical protein